MIINWQEGPNRTNYNDEMHWSTVLTSNLCWEDGGPCSPHLIANLLFLRNFVLYLWHRNQNPNKCKSISRLPGCFNGTTLFHLNCIRIRTLALTSLNYGNAPKSIFIFNQFLAWLRNSVGWKVEPNNGQKFLLHHSPWFCFLLFAEVMMYSHYHNGMIHSSVEAFR